MHQLAARIRTHLTGKLLPGVLCALVLGCGSSLNKKGYDSLELGDYRMAQQFFQQQLDKNPRDHLARVGIAKSFIQQSGEHPHDSTLWQQALTHLEAARTINPSVRMDSLLAEAWIIYGLGLYSIKDTLSGLEAIARALQYSPASPQALNSAAIAYHHYGDIAKATTLLEKAVESDPQSPVWKYNLAMVYFSQGSYEQAHHYWVGAAKQAPEDEDILYWLARIQQLRATAADSRGATE